MHQNAPTRGYRARNHRPLLSHSLITFVPCVGNDSVGNDLVGNDSVGNDSVGNVSVGNATVSG